MFKNVLIALLGVSLVLMSRAYLQSERPFPLPDNPEAAAKFKSFKFSFKSNPGG